MNDRKPLTVAILKSLKFKMTMHLNGGSKFSELHHANEEYGLVLGTKTNGSPQYLTTEKVLQTKDFTIEADLLAKDSETELAKFVDAYNSKERTT